MASKKSNSNQSEQQIKEAASGFVQEFLQSIGTDADQVATKTHEAEQRVQELEKKLKDARGRLEELQQVDDRIRGMAEKLVAVVGPDRRVVLGALQSRFGELLEAPKPKVQRIPVAEVADRILIAMREAATGAITVPCTAAYLQKATGYDQARVQTALTFLRNHGKVSKDGVGKFTVYRERAEEPVPESNAHPVQAT